MQSSEIISFWFEETPARSWFQNDPEFDLQIRNKFLTIHQAAVAGELFSWRGSALGRLAEIIILDQFSRNIFRGEAEAFAYDRQALVLSQEAVDRNCLDELQVAQQSFLIMPYMHSESKIIHEQAVKYFSRPGLEFNLEFEHKHKDIIDRFGRYPHRNAILGRASSAEEKAFLELPGSSF